MLDIRKIKENPDAVKAGLKAKEVDCDAIIDKILELDVQVRSLKTSTETKTAEKNKLAKENGKLFGQKKGAEKKGEDTSALDAQIAANMARSVQIDEEIAGDKAALKELDAQADAARKVPGSHSVTASLVPERTGVLSSSDLYEPRREA